MCCFKKNFVKKIFGGKNFEQIFFCKIIRVHFFWPIVSFASCGHLQKTPLDTFFLVKVEFLGGWVRCVWWCKVIIVSNQTQC